MGTMLDTLHSVPEGLGSVMIIVNIPATSRGGLGSSYGHVTPHRAMPHAVGRISIVICHGNGSIGPRALVWSLSGSGPNMVRETHWPSRLPNDT